MQTFTTQTAAIQFLVAQGKPENIAKVAIHQAYDFEGDLLMRNVSSEIIEAINAGDLQSQNYAGCTRIIGAEDGMAVVEANESQLLDAYKTFEEMCLVTATHIEINGDPIYDLRGNFIGC